MLNTVFKDKYIADNRVHCVTQLSYPYKYYDDWPVNVEQHPFPRMFYLSHKFIKEATTEDCADLIFHSAQLAVTGGKIIQ